MVVESEFVYFTACILTVLLVVISPEVCNLGDLWFSGHGVLLLSPEGYPLRNVFLLVNEILVMFSFVLNVGVSDSFPNYYLNVQSHVI